MLRTFNGFYTKTGIFVLHSQTRILLALTFTLIVILVTSAILLRKYLRRRNRVSRSMSREH